MRWLRALPVIALLAAAAPLLPTARAAGFLDAEGYVYASADHELDADSDDSDGVVPFATIFDNDVSAEVVPESLATGESTGEALATADQYSEIVRQGDTLKSFSSRATVTASATEAVHADGSRSNASALGLSHVLLNFRLPETKRMTLQGSLTAVGQECVNSTRLALLEFDDFGFLRRRLMDVEAKASCASEPGASNVGFSDSFRFGRTYNYRLMVETTTTSHGDEDPDMTTASWELRLGAPGDSPQIECGDTITRSIVLDRDLLCNGDALYVGAQNVTLDLGGHTISGDGDPGDFGIDNSAGHDDLTIKRGTISGFGTGIHQAQGEGTTLSGLRVEDNAVHGVSLADTLLGIIRNVKANGNGQDGFHLDCGDCEISNNTAERNVNGDGIQLFGNTIGSGNNIVVDNFLRDNRFGIRISDGSDFNTLRRNEALFSTQDGFFVDSDNNTFKEENVAKYSAGDGVHLNNASGNRFVDTLSQDNRRYGFEIAGGGGNLFAKGESCGTNTIDPTTGCDLAQNVARQNDFEGFFFINTNDNVLMGNSAIRNHQGGFNLVGSTRNAFKRTLALHNEGPAYGIRIGSGSTHNTLRRSLVLDTEGDGIVVAAADDNRIYSSNVSENSGDGIVVDATSDRSDLQNNTSSEHRQGAGFLIRNASTTGTSNNAFNNHTDCDVITGASIECL